MISTKSKALNFRPCIKKMDLTELYKKIEDPVDIIDSQYLIIATISRRDLLRGPKCLMFCDNFIGYLSQNEEGNIVLFRTVVTRYSLILGKKPGASFQPKWELKQEKITKKNKKSIEANFNKLLVETKKI